MNQRFYTPEQLDNAIRLTGRNEAGDLAANVQLSGMSPFALDHLTVLEGDLSKLYEDGGKYVAAVYAEDDYGRADMDSHWARLGIRSPSGTWRSGNMWTRTPASPTPMWRMYPPGPTGWRSRPSTGDAAYQVAALVTVPSALSYRYYGSDEFILTPRPSWRTPGPAR